MTAPTNEEPQSIRLAKHVQDMLSCSRREAELYIIGGWVRVDGEVIETPQHRVTATQQIALDPAATPAPIELVTILLHQAAGDELAALSADNHAEGDFSGVRLLQRHFSQLTTTMPLQAGASGLVILTQDERILQKLKRDAATIEEEYIVEVSGVENMPAHGMKQLNFSLSYDGRSLPPAKVSWQNESHLRIAAKNLQRGQIAYMCEMVGLTLLAMKRIRIGRIAMSKMPQGQWRYLPLGEKF
jgi:23S rRNA pseudouridine2604 synthase